MNNEQAMGHIEECHRMIDLVNWSPIPDNQTATAIGRLCIAIDQLSVVVADLANREQGKVIE